MDSTPGRREQRFKGDPQRTMQKKFKEIAREKKIGKRQKAGERKEGGKKCSC